MVVQVLVGDVDDEVNVETACYVNKKRSLHNIAWVDTPRHVIVNRVIKDKSLF